MKRGKLTRTEKLMYAVGWVQLTVGIFIALGGWDNFAVGLMLAIFGFVTMGQVWRDRRWFNTGWITGRAQMVATLAEAQARGLHPIEWLIGEMERDGYEIHIEEEK